MKISRTLICALLTSTLASGCLENRQFYATEELKIITPVENDFAEAPLTVTWVGTPDGTKRWAVFLDRAPIRPGKSVDDLENDERGNLWITDDSSLLIDAIAPRSTSVASRKGRHRIAVVALDGNGKRIGEHVSSVELTVIQP